MAAKRKRPTRDQLAEQYGISVPSVDRAKKAGVDVYDMEAMLEYLQNRQRPGKPDNSPTGQDLNTARTKLVNLQCEKLKIAIQKDRGELLDKVTVDDAMYRLGLLNRMAWDKLPDELPPMLEGLTAAKMKSKLMPFARLKQKEFHEGQGLEE